MIIPLVVWPFSGEAHRYGLARVIPYSCEFVVSIFLVGSAGFPISLLVSLLGPPGWGGDHIPLLGSPAEMVDS